MPLIRSLALSLLTVASLLFPIPEARGQIGSLAYLDARPGFRDVVLDTPFSTFRDLIAVETLGPGWVCYERVGEDLTIADGELRSIRYCFEHRVLQEIVLEASGANNTDALLGLFQASFGSGKRERGLHHGAPRRIVWSGQRAIAYYGEPADAQLAQARIRVVGGAERAPAALPPSAPAVRDEVQPVRPDVPAAGELRLAAPRRARRGQVATVTIRYRELQGPGTLSVSLPEGTRLSASTPKALLTQGIYLWDKLEKPAANLQLKVHIEDTVPLGTALEIRALLTDAAGGETSESVVVRVR